MQKKMSPKMNIGTPTRIWINFFLGYSQKRRGQNDTFCSLFLLFCLGNTNGKDLLLLPDALKEAVSCTCSGCGIFPALEQESRRFPAVHGTAFLPLQVALAGKMPASASDRKSQRPTPLQSSLLVSRTAKNTVLVILTVKFPAALKRSELDAIHVPASVEWFPRLRLTVSSQCHRAPHFAVADIKLNLRMF